MRPRLPDPGRRRGVDDGRSLTPWREMDPLRFCQSSVFGCCAGPAFEAVAAALEGDDLGVLDQPVDHGSGHHVVAEHLALPAQGLLLVTIRLARSRERTHTVWPTGSCRTDSSCGRASSLATIWELWSMRPWAARV